MDIPLDEQILNTLEVFHYANRFRNTLFALVVDDSDTLRPLLPDLRVLHAAQIRMIVLAPASAKLERHLKRWARRGHQFRYLPSTPELLMRPEQVQAVHDSFSAGAVPVIAVDGPPLTPFEPCAFYDTAFGASASLHARKVILPGPFPGLTAHNACLSHLLPRDLRALLTEGTETNLSTAFVEYLAAQQERASNEVILLQKKSGVLYQEVFTHRGAGTLITQDYPNLFRRAEAADVADIALLMKPYIKSGAILPVSEAKIFDDLKDYYVYTVNGQVVASAKLTAFGDHAEIGKICTLPRYQRKGRARAITEQIVALARTKGFTAVFSLSTQERMFVFFRQLGFDEVSRESLPEQWRKHYNFGRPSRAFRLALRPA